MTDGQTYRVLLVDDEESTFEFVGDLLKKYREDDFEITWLVEFDQAVAALMGQKYDACLMDYNMGDFTGLDLMQHVQEKGCRIPIIMLTGHNTREVDIGALGAGAAEFLDKTRLRPELLARTIRYAVRQQADKNKLEDLYRQVSELEQLKTDMIRIAAHDLRTPLMTMLNYANFLGDDKDHPLVDYQQGYVAEITSAVRRMQTIISDILSLERIQETAADQYKQIVNVPQEIHEAVKAAFTPDNGRVCHVNVTDEKCYVMGDASQLREAAANLMTNAVKYTPDGGEITVSLDVENEEVVFKVKDTGYGIPDDMQQRLFQPFYRAKSKETRHIAGTGLGLHLVRNIIQRHKGDIFFSSVYGEGSTFGFRIPVYKGES